MWLPRLKAGASAPGGSVVALNILALCRHDARHASPPLYRRLRGAALVLQVGPYPNEGMPKVMTFGAGEPMKHVWPPKRHVIRLSSVNGRSSQRTLSGWPTAHGRRSLLDRAEPELDDGSQRVPHRPQKPVAEAGR